MNLFDFDENSLFNQALIRGLEGKAAEERYAYLTETLHVPPYIARKVTLKEVDIPEERLFAIGRIFGRWYYPGLEKKP